MTAMAVALTLSACGNGSMFSEGYQRKWAGYYDRPGNANAAAMIWMQGQGRFVDQTWPAPSHSPAITCTTAGINTTCLPDPRY